MTEKRDGLVRVRRASADLRGEWERNAPAWIAWAREPDHDSYWVFHRDEFLAGVPDPGRRTLDLGCGEGRLSRDLERMGHRIVGLDVSPTMLGAARSAAPHIPVCLADAARAPFADGSFDLVIAFMSLQDIDEASNAIGEAARVLQPGGRLCLAVVHPFSSAGRFETDAPDSVFRVDISYLDVSYIEDTVVRDGLEVLFPSAHRPLHAYIQAITGAGLLIDRLAEPRLPERAIHSERARRWQRMPLFLHMRAVKPGG
jgi:SAM-dependent methyltransferase